MQNADCYVDLGNGERETMLFFLLNALLQSRIETGHESDGDEEVNVYITGLLHSIVDGTFYVDNGGRLAASPLDVAQIAGQAGTVRGKASVYRTNADCRLMEFGLFSGCGGYVSLYRQAMTPQPAETYLEQAEQFYAWAALLCSRMPARYRGLALTLYKLAEGFDIYRQVLSHMGANYIGLLARLSAGQMAHLEHDAHQAALPAIAEHALDRMLDAFNRWKADPTAATRAAFLDASGPYCLLKPGFDPATLVPKPPDEGGNANEN
ncbi:MAG: hypothetical protein HY473_02590 [Candidatus Sungbacteria bacterium]|uniref:Uncharacterized protein n=1 Tax=Candidatus Sungiibacteriota bacterium TaxID=2750080 RepID=A0A932YWV5_9BACT|nr:hypothetical protein [Parcubacteria group bacterium]MBI4132947.1 hypothetical protein [Candidatus Sungbacteria bacterium]